MVKDNILHTIRLLMSLMPNNPIDYLNINRCKNESSYQHMDKLMGIKLVIHICFCLELDLQSIHEDKTSHKSYLLNRHNNLLGIWQHKYKSINQHKFLQYSCQRMMEELSLNRQIEMNNFSYKFYQGNLRNK